MKKKLFLIDSSSLIFRAFYAIRNLSTSSGHPTNATYGFLTMFLGLLEKYKPDAVVAVFDTPSPSFRKKQYSEYKSNRSAPPDDLIPQFQDIRDLVDVLKIPRFEEPGFEADDVIAYLVKRFPECEIMIVTGDKDLMQLVNKQVRILDTMKDKIYGPDEVFEKLGVGPELVTDYLGLIGDTSDNIPGIPGIGPKTAVQLLGEYKTLEGVLESTALMKPSKRTEAIEQNKELAILSKQLATVEFNVTGSVTKVNLEDLFYTLKPSKPFVDFLKRLEFKTQALKWGGLLASSGEEVSSEGSSVVRVGASEPEVKAITTESELRSLLETLSKAEKIAFDTETRGERTTDLEMVGLSLCSGKDQTFYIPFRHQGLTTQLPLKAVSSILETFRGKKIIAQNLKYDYKVLLREGYELEEYTTNFFDTMLADYLVAPEEKHGLDMLALRYLNGLTVGDFKQVLGDKKDFSEVDLETAKKYSGMDSWSTYLLEEPLNQQLDLLKMQNLFKEIEMPVAPILARMENVGIAVDPNVLGKLSEEYARELKLIEAEIYAHAGSEFNLNSPKQLSEILFVKLGLPVISKTKTGFSTDVSVLEKLAPIHPMPALMVRYRELTKLKSTYIDVLPTLIEPDGRVHAHFNQAVAATGRLSGSDPNLQNIPIKTESGRRIRQAFVAADGCVLVGADYSQIELRLVAHLSGDETLISAFKSGQDVHRSTAAEIFGVSLNQVTDEQRSAAKAINFGLIYGKTPFGLSQELGISRKDAEKYIQTYFERYSGVKKFMDQCIADAREHKMSQTIYGRKRPLKDIDNKNAGLRNMSERMALNTPVQGTAADIMKIAMIRVDETCHRTGAHLILQVHDELILDVAEDKASEARACLQEGMESAEKLKVPLTVNVGVAKSWYEL